MCNCNSKSEKFRQLEEIIALHKEKPGALIPVMHEAQDLFGCLPLDVQTEIAKGLNVPLSDIYGIATFYSKFTLQPKGRYQINVCLGTACYVKGAQTILDKISETLHISVGETTSDGLFSLTGARCIGACGLAPVMTINEKVYGELDADQVEVILKKYLEEVWGNKKDVDSSAAK